MGNISNAFGEDFDVGKNANTESYDLLPNGWYKVMAERAEIKQTKSGTGSYINIQYTIIGENCKGRKVFGMITLTNQNDTAVDIGKHELSAFGRSIGLEKITDSAQLLKRPLQIRLKIENSDKYGEQNRVNGYRKFNGDSPDATNNVETAIPDSSGYVAPVGGDNDIPF